VFSAILSPLVSELTAPAQSSKIPEISREEIQQRLHDPKQGKKKAARQMRAKIYG